MKALALKTTTWSCNENKYECEAGKELEIKASDLNQAKASNLFEIKAPKKRKAKKDI
jgi:hypothetical protein